MVYRWFIYGYMVNIWWISGFSINIWWISGWYMVSIWIIYGNIWYKVYLVGGWLSTPLKKIRVRQFWDEDSIPNMWKNKDMFQTTNQLWFYMVLLGLSWFDCFDGLRICMQVQRKDTSEPRVRLCSDPAKLFPRLWIPCITGWLWTLWFPAIHGQSHLQTITALGSQPWPKYLLPV